MLCSNPASHTRRLQSSCSVIVVEGKDANGGESTLSPATTRNESVAKHNDGSSVRLLVIGVYTNVASHCRKGKSRSASDVSVPVVLLM